MKLRKRLELGVYGLLVLCILVSWGSAALLSSIAVVPLGLCPVLVMAGSMGSRISLVGSILVVLLVYAWMFCSIWGVSRRKRFGTVSFVILLTLDLGANIVCSAVSWWYLVAVGLDLLLLALTYLMYRSAGAQKQN